MDTQLERDIDLGNRYKFDPMKEGQCLVNEQLAESLKVTAGDIIYIKMDMFQNIMALVDQYNIDVADQLQLNTISKNEITRSNARV